MIEKCKEMELRKEKRRNLRWEKKWREINFIKFLSAYQSISYSKRISMVNFKVIK